MDKRKKRKFLERAKTISRLVYHPGRDKGKFVAGLRRKLQSRVVTPQSQPPVASTLKIGTININGLTLDSGWAAEQLI